MKKIKVIFDCNTWISFAMDGRLKKLADFLNEVSKGYDKPEMFFSLYSGFNNAIILKKIEEKAFVPICVPKDNHCISYENRVLKIKELEVYFEKKKQNISKKIQTKPLFAGELRQLIECTNEKLFLSYFV